MDDKRFFRAYKKDDPFFDKLLRQRIAEAGNYHVTFSEMEDLKREGTAYLMQPGDAIYYSGTGHAHWRETIQPGNFFDLVFFHFATEELLLKEQSSKRV